MRVDTFFNAARDGDLEAIFNYIGEGQNIDARNAGGASAIELASESGNEGIVAALLNAGANVEPVESPCFTSALILASTYNHAEVVEQLLAHGAVPDVQDEEGQTALIWAISHDCSPRIIRALLKAGADPALKDSKGHSAIDYAKGFGYDHLLAILQGEGI